MEKTKMCHHACSLWRAQAPTVASARVRAPPCPATGTTSMPDGECGLWHISKLWRQRAHLQTTASTDASSNTAASGPPQRRRGVCGQEASGPPPKICVARREPTLFCVSFGLLGKIFLCILWAGRQNGSCV